VTHALDQPARGNHTTVQRWVRHVRDADVRMIAPDADAALDPVPDVVHGYHALHAGPAALALARRHRRPLVVSLGGTDLYAALQGDALVAEVLHSAARVTGAFAAFGEMLAMYYGRALPYRVVPRGVEIPATSPPRAPHDGLRVLLPAGLRPVKDPMLAIDLAELLVARGVALDLRILGPEQDRGYARRVRDRCEPLPFVHVAGAVVGDMAPQYAWADVTWNTSFREGGSNALLEAVSHGCAIFARDIPGNHELLREDGAPDALFDAADKDRTERFHRALLTETPEKTIARVEAGRAWLRRHHDPSHEARTLEAVWHDAAAQHPPRA
jgi:glycosyltransferase involved in cell wall biosynthesis